MTTPTVDLLALPDDLWSQVNTHLAVRERICVGATCHSLRGVGPFMCGDHAQAALKDKTCAQILRLRTEWESHCFGRVVIDGRPMLCLTMTPARFALRSVRLARVIRPHQAIGL